MKGRKDDLDVMASIDEMMYSCGVEVLHPGGIEKTLGMAEACGIAEGSRILDVGCGKGNTAILLARKYGCEVVGVDQSRDMVGYAKAAVERAGLSARIDFVCTDARNLPFEDGVFDVVFAECSTVLMDRALAFAEFQRVLKPGGRIGDLEMSWKKAPTKAIADRAFELWEGFSTMTFDQWRSFYSSIGLMDVRIDDFSDALGDMGKNYMKWLGLSGILKVLWRTVTDWRLMRGMIEYEKLFREGAEYIGYGYFVGRKS